MRLTTLSSGDTSHCVALHCHRHPSRVKTWGRQFGVFLLQRQGGMSLLCFAHVLESLLYEVEFGDWEGPEASFSLDTSR